MATFELGANCLAPPLLSLVDSADVIATVFASRPEPRLKAPFCVVIAACTGVEDELHPYFTQTVGEIDVFSSPIPDIERSSCDEMLTGHRCVARVELPKGCRVVTSLNRCRLPVQQMLLPSHPRASISSVSCELRTHDLHAITKLCMGAHVALEEVRGRDDIVVNDENQPCSSGDTSIARCRRSLVSLEQRDNWNRQNDEDLGHSGKTGR